MANNNNKYQKLELTWIGKGEEPKLEPRILIENPEYSYGDPNTENMLIHGDNLLALKALEQDYAGKIKFVYIDPPFNTGSAFDHYEDGIEHSIWLDLMHRRLIIIKDLLAKEGSIMIHLDDNESDYCKILMDQVFERENFINRITIEARSPSAFSTVNPGVFKASEYILWYAKNKSAWESRSMRIITERDTAYNKFILNRHLSPDHWDFLPLKLAFLKKINSERIECIEEFIYKLYVDGPSITKPELSRMIISSFTFSMLLNVKQFSTYVSSKLKLGLPYADFYSYLFPYLLEKCSIRYVESDIDSFVIDNSDSVFRETEISDEGAGKETVDLKYQSMEKPNRVLCLERGNGLDPVYVVNGKQISFYSKNIAEIDGIKVPTKLLTNIWTDISWEGIANEGNVKFKKGKKPERLIRRCIELNTNPKDIVLDSFLGSGTTAAVAHKMGRRWIGVELGDHAKTHCYPRLKAVVDGEQGGISKAVDWKGGRGFKFYTLAPSLLNTDQYGNWVISKEYNANMLAAAMAKQEGFRYQPDETVYWKQGKSSEKDYIFTTTQFVTVEALDKIHDEMHPDESLLIACKAFQIECESRHGNISIKKIPGMLLGKCEFGKDDYSLNIVNVPTEEQENSAGTDTVFELPVIPDVPKPERKKKPKDDMPTLF